MGKAQLTKNDYLLIDHLNKSYLSSINLHLMYDKTNATKIDITAVKEVEADYVGTLYFDGKKWTYSVMQLISHQTYEQPEEWDDVESGRLFTSWEQALKDLLVQTWSAEFEEAINMFWIDYGDSIKEEVEREKEYGNS